MTNMSDTGRYFQQPAVTTNFALHTIGTAKNATEAIPEIPHNSYHNNDEQIVFTGFRMDGDDTLMSAEERMQIISTKKNYKASA